ncbi:MAG: long-chain fatty acid--CoA ligase [Candidatus Melainabacteria bacterium]|nr:long-chain fatty acid--CoA ligase [Candidatus Melainabacteria bacterium]
MIASNLAELFKNQASKNSNRIAVEYRLRRNESFKTISWEYFNTVVKEVAYGLIELGLHKGQKIAILSDTRYEWAVCDLAALSCGGVVVPIYPTLPNEAVAYILNNSECQIVIVEDKGQLQKIRSQWSAFPQIKYAVVIEDLGDIPEHDDKIISLRKLRDKGMLNFSKDPYLIDKHIDDVCIDDVATIIYTSGTTGQPKGVMLTHKNILSVISVLSKMLPIKSTDKFLSFLPLSHVFERVGGLYYAISTQTTISYCKSIDQIGPSLKDSGATIMLVVPRILEKIHSKINSQLKTSSGLKKAVFNWAYAVGERIVSKKNNGKLISPFDLVLAYIADKLVFSSIRKKLAPRLTCFVSGGAPLLKEIGEFFYIIGIPVLEGYGLTETSAPATANTLKELKIGTVGKPLPNVQVKIADDGEILIKGPNVFLGYYKNQEATNEALSDGWFSTGDIGEFDKDGFLKITDRKKDIIVNSAGKKIPPQNLENALKTSPYISNVVVIGDKRKYLCALVTLDHVSISSYAKEHKLSNADDFPRLIKEPQIVNLIEEEIKLKTANCADYEQIRKFTILPDDFTIKSGEITPTLKVKRKYVQEKYKRLIDLMYPPE